MLRGCCGLLAGAPYAVQVLYNTAGTHVTNLRPCLPLSLPPPLPRTTPNRCRLRFRTQLSATSPKPHLMRSSAATRCYTSLTSPPSSAGTPGLAGGGRPIGGSGCGSAPLHRECWAITVPACPHTTTATLPPAPARPHARPRRLFSFLRPGGRLLLTDYCKAPGEPSEGFAAYIAQRGYDLHTLEVCVWWCGGVGWVWAAFGSTGGHAWGQRHAGTAAAPAAHAPLLPLPLPHRTMLRCCGTRALRAWRRLIARSRWGVHFTFDFALETGCCARARRFRSRHTPPAGCRPLPLPRQLATPSLRHRGAPAVQVKPRAGAGGGRGGQGGLCGTVWAGRLRRGRWAGCGAVLCVWRGRKTGARHDRGRTPACLPSPCSRPPYPCLASAPPRPAQVVDSWRAKLDRVEAGEQQWGLFRAYKPAAGRDFHPAAPEGALA